jgi:hypothetical protein
MSEVKRDQEAHELGDSFYLGHDTYVMHQHGDMFLFRTNGTSTPERIVLSKDAWKLLQGWQAKHLPNYSY